MDPGTDIWRDATEDASVQILAPRLTAISQTTQIQRLSDRRPSSINAYLLQAASTGEAVSLGVDQWSLDEVTAPNITDKDTVINFALMASNAYVEIPYEGDWQNISGRFNESQGFGWQGDGLRGHIFADQNNETIVMSLKGASPAVFDGEGTTSKDIEYRSSPMSFNQQPERSPS